MFFSCVVWNQVRAGRDLISNSCSMRLRPFVSSMSPLRYCTVGPTLISSTFSSTHERGGRKTNLLLLLLLALYRLDLAFKVLELLRDLVDNLGRDHPLLDGFGRCVLHCEFDEFAVRFSDEGDGSE
jgi:hypothetical protein